MTDLKIWTMNTYNQMLAANMVSSFMENKVQEIHRLIRWKKLCDLPLTTHDFEHVWSFYSGQHV